LLRLGRTVGREPLARGTQLIVGTRRCGAVAGERFIERGRLGVISMARELGGTLLAVVLDRRCDRWRQRRAAADYCKRGGQQPAAPQRRFSQ
jgi:hypothetical protein